MTKRMLLDASHPEETRVVVLSNNRLDEFDSETKEKKQLKGNIYLAKVTRVEPSLQAAFVDYGGNRHGFLPFSEIHPDYYRLPIADREALLEEEQAAQKREDDGDADGEAGSGVDSTEPDGEAEAAAAGAKRRVSADGEADSSDPEVEQLETGNSVETLAGDEIEDAARRRAAFLGRYKIQEVIKRRQVILVQVVKEERGNKGAALTTYLSLAGRYCVLMPNTNKGGGISRKIANTKDRRRLKGVLSELNIPDGIAVIVRTAGSNRTKAEIKRDYEYLLRTWDHIRETTLQSTAPCAIYEEANLIKRAIRDLYTRDMDHVLVEGEEGYKAAKAFMRSLMPSHAKKVQKYDDPKVPLFHRYQVESQLDNIHNPTVQLKSGGYIVMNQTEALVAIDVNSGKATKERHIEETALKTNLEAAEEVARQLKLRDLAGLIVIDFIDMDAAKNNREVEQRLKEAMRQDRARIQLGRISPFGLLELSRQRLRPSLHETSTEVCRSCGGSGFVRSPESTALHVLRALEEEGIRGGGGEVMLTLPAGVALYTLNEKRSRLFEIERRYNFRVRVQTDDHLVPPAYRLDRLSTVAAEEEIAAEGDIPAEAGEAVERETPAQREDAEEAAGKSRKRGRRGGRKNRKTAEGAEAAEAAQPASEEDGEAAAVAAAESTDSAVQEESVEAGPAAAGEEDEDQKAKRRRRRGKRGGRRRSKRRDDEGAMTEAAEATPGGEDAVAAESGEAAAAAPAEGEAESAVTEAEVASATATAEAESVGERPSPEPAMAEAPAEDAHKPAEATTVGGEEAEGEAAAKPAKPARRRTTRRKPAKAAAAEADTGEAAQETAPQAAADVSGTESEAATESAATEADSKPKSRSRSTAKTTGRKKATTSSTSVKSGTKTTTTRTRRTTKSKAKATEEKTAEPASEAAPVEPSERAEPSQPQPEPATATSSTGEGFGGPASDTAGGEVAEPQGADKGGEQAEEDERPRRRGWWQRLMS